MTREGRTLSSGEMVRESGLSIKALRLYDSKGLLVPAHVDERTGYRAYAVEQLERARRIALLRRLELPLARVAAVVDADPADARTLLLAWWVERRDSLAEQREAASELARSLGAAPEPAGAAAAELAVAVGRREVHERTVATITSRAGQADLVPTFTAAALTIRRHLAQAGADAAPGHWVTYHRVPLGEEPGVVETSVPYTGSVSPAGDIVLRVEPARAEAYLEVPVRHCGFPEIVGYHDALRAAGAIKPTREAYHGTWSDEPDEIVAEVTAELTGV